MPNVSQEVIDILLDLGYDEQDLATEQGLRRALKEGIVTIEFQTKGSGDERSVKLREAFGSVRKPGKKPEANNNKPVDTQKFFKPRALPGSKNVGTKLLESSEEVQKNKKETVTVIADALLGVANGLLEINKLLKAQLNFEEKEAKAEDQAALALRRQANEDESEKKVESKAKAEKASIPKIEVPFLDRIKKFFGNVIAGGVVSWLAKPENRDKIDGFFNFLEDWGGLILGGIAALLAVGVVMQVATFVTSLLAVAKGLTAIFGMLGGGILGKILLMLGAGLGATKLTERIGKRILYGETPFIEAEEQLNREAVDAGLHPSTLLPGRQTRRGIKGTGKPRTPAQEDKATFIEGERKRIAKLRDLQNAELKTVADRVPMTGTYKSGVNKGKKYHTEDDKKLIKAAEKAVREKYKLILSVPGAMSLADVEAAGGTKVDPETTKPETSSTTTTTTTTTTASAESVTPTASDEESEFAFQPVRGLPAPGTTPLEEQGVDMQKKKQNKELTKTEGEAVHLNTEPPPFQTPTPAELQKKDEKQTQEESLSMYDNLRKSMLENDKKQQELLKSLEPPQKVSSMQRYQQQLAAAKNMSGSSGSQAEVPAFSPVDPNNLNVSITAGIYNAPVMV